MSMSQGISVLGIPIPSRDPWFLTLIAIHVAAGVVASVAGALAMLSAKTAGRHPRSGKVYFWALAIVSITMAELALLRWPVDNTLAVLGLIAISSASLGRLAKRRRWPRWRRVHIPAMATSYIVMLTAFYVDNGPHLPLWNRLPVLTYWLLPAAVGGPLILYAWRKHIPADEI
jgi:hypothetical protein